MHKELALWTAMFFSSCLWVSRASARAEEKISWLSLPSCLSVWTTEISARTSPMFSLTQLITKPDVNFCGIYPKRRGVTVSGPSDESSSTTLVSHHRPRLSQWKNVLHLSSFAFIVVVFVEPSDPALKNIPRSLRRSVVWLTLNRTRCVISLTIHFSYGFPSRDHTFVDQDFVVCLIHILSLEHTHN